MTKEQDSRVLRLVPRDADEGAAFRAKFKSIQEKKPKVETEGKEEYRKGGEALRSIRSRMNLTRVEFAELFGLSETIVGKWERAVVRPKGHTLNSMKFLLEKAGFKQYADMLRPEDFGYRSTTTDQTEF